MGYYTDYTLTITNADDILLTQREELTKEIEAMKVFENGDIDIGWYAFAKWYDYEDDMTALSLKFPEVVFCLHGDGEDTEDIWNAYYCAGKQQFCPGKITYDEFDRSKLMGVKTPAGIV